VVWALKHFRDIILGYQIHVLTDHSPVTGLFKDKNHTGKRARWQLTLQEYEPSFDYIPGKVNTAADALSRNVASIIFISQNLLNFDLSDSKERQRSDPYCCSITYFHGSDDDTFLNYLF